MCHSTGGKTRLASRPVVAVLRELDLTTTCVDPAIPLQKLDIALVEAHATLRLNSPLMWGIISGGRQIAFSRTLRMLRPSSLIVALLMLQCGTSMVWAAEPKQEDVARQFDSEVRPFLKTYCVSCHGGAKPESDLDLSTFATLESVTKDHARWALVLDRLKAGDMPPEDAESRPTDESRIAIVNWIESARALEARRQTGDPGVVLPRRLSNAEYDYTIQDLTGFDIRPTREFPIDPANEAGFDNSGESLTMSPALVKKYLEAARLVADHLVLLPSELTFAPHPVMTDTDRDKYCVNRILAFYRRQPLAYKDYFRAAWRFKHRAVLGKPEQTLAEFAVEEHVSLKYLATIQKVLEESPDEKIGPIAGLQALWNEIPSPVGDGNQDDAAASFEKMQRYVIGLRDKVKSDFPNLKIRSVNDGSQPLVLWKNRQYATHRRTYNGKALELTPADLALDTAASPLLQVPADESAKQEYEAAFARFCDVFPDKFLVSERARVFLKEEDKGNVGRFLSAGFHSQMGYFRDDAPLYDLILDEGQQRELDRLWQELDFVAMAPLRQHMGFIWFERAESSFLRGPQFDFARAEDKDSASPEKLNKLAEVYLEKIERSTDNATAIQAVKDHFTSIEASLRRVEKEKQGSEPTHVAALADLAERAYRRPLSLEERDGITKFYNLLRNEDHLDHEEAIRDSLVAILMSPHFCYRVDVPLTGEGIYPLSDYALASRLSYFLWSSMPDAELLAEAKAGHLHEPEVLLRQTRRMIRDERARGLATEFGGNWLDFRRFEEHNAVDRERFPNFTNELRQAMFEEPIRFLLDIVQNDRSVLDFLYGKHTFVNPVLARHYEMPAWDGASDDWHRIENADQYGRGGLLPMAVFMTKFAPGLRTSPVKRGYWVVRRMLGEHIPAPPPNVAELPADEAKLGDLTLPQMLAKHREDKSCAVCHVRFDSVGLAFEGYGATGERRLVDFGGKPVQTAAVFPDGSQGDALDGLRTYLRERRQGDFVDNLCRKLLTNALGRSLILSDDILIQDMKSRLAASEYRFSSLIETIVTSPQFLTQRGRGPAEATSE
jgi:hypothetical protein